jgi:hypothetical protein
VIADLPCKWKQSWEGVLHQVSVGEQSAIIDNAQKNRALSPVFLLTAVVFMLLSLSLSGCGGGGSGEDDASGSSDASLSELTLDGIALDQTFQADQLNYSASVDFSQDSITLSPVVADSGATIQINGSDVASGTASAPIALVAGENQIDIVVTSGNRSTTVTYTLVVSRAMASLDASLSDLNLYGATLDQIFQSSQTAYSASVGFLQASVTLTPVATDGGATIQVNGTEVASGTASAAIALSEGQNTVSLVVTAEDGVTSQRYSIEILRDDTTSFAQQAYLKASNAEGGHNTYYDFHGDELGYSVAISGDTLVVGTPGGSRRLTGIEWKNSSINFGAAYVFIRSNGIWSQQAYLEASNADSEDQFGTSVAISGDTLVVGAIGEDSSINGGEEDNSAFDAGAVYVFTRSNGVWNQQAFLKASYIFGKTLNGAIGNEFGYSVAISGDTLVVGSPNADSSDDHGDFNELVPAPSAGAVFVFTRSGGIWSQQAYLKASTAEGYYLFGSGFGTSVAISGDTLVVGCPSCNALKGETFVFTRGGGTTWREQAYLNDSDGAVSYFGGGFGASVAIADDTLVVGHPIADTAYVFTRNGKVWAQQADLMASNAEQWDDFGHSVAISDDTLVVGAPHEDSNATGGEADNSAPHAGAAYVWQ